MDIKDFKAGFWTKQYNYKSFSPALVNIEWVISNPRINTLLSEANLLLGELNAFSQYVPSVDFFIMMHVVKEATTSSRIEGTQTSIEEAILKIEDIDPEKRDDWNEVQNYIEAMNFAIGQLNQLPISSRLLRKTHQILLQSVRGEHKQPGDYRSSQNWIGGATLADATFIPPHHTELHELMGDLEKFLNNETLHVPKLIVVAIAHYQFETIHPFLDGNGRLGRLLITLYLISNKILTKPTLYLSAFFEKHRTLYYDNLMVVRQKNDLEQWITFFLVGVVETTKKAKETLIAILKLKEKHEATLYELGTKAAKAKTLLEYLFQHPIVSAAVVAKVLGISPPTANSLLREFERLNILKETTGYKRNRLFVFQETTGYKRNRLFVFQAYLDLFYE
ncbi:MAG: Fic family protein [Spirosomaceae bacterium]|nr:Fic family protein [Spirosomataceae bacterium]